RRRLGLFSCPALFPHSARDLPPPLSPAPLAPYASAARAAGPHRRRPPPGQPAPRAGTLRLSNPRRAPAPSAWAASASGPLRLGKPGRRPQPPRWPAPPAPSYRPLAAPAPTPSRAGRPVPRRQPCPPPRYPAAWDAPSPGADHARYRRIRPISGGAVHGVILGGVMEPKSEFRGAATQGGPVTKERQEFLSVVNKEMAKKNQESIQGC
ncbi:hypothetical protein U9M48_019170, partial [Paspalum notatum var. saurae]